MGLRFDDGRVGVVGVGLVGGSIVRALSDRGYHVWGYDPDATVARQMAQQGYEQADDVSDLVSGSSLVILATPPHVTMELLRNVPALNPAAVITTTTSVMAPLAGVVRTLAPADAARVVLGHPIAGLEFSGFDRSRSDMFWTRTPASDEPLGATWALAPTSGEPEALAAAIAVSSMVDVLRADTLFVDPVGHDQAVAYSSQLPQLTASALAQSAPPHLRARAMLLSGRSLYDATRTASSDPEVASQAALANRAALRSAVHDMQVLLERLEAYLDEEAVGVFDDLQTLLAEGMRARSALYQRRWRERRWAPYELDPVNLADLIRLGQDGGLLRRIHLDGARFSGEVARAS